MLQISCFYNLLVISICRVITESCNYVITTIPCNCVHLKWSDVLCHLTPGFPVFSLCMSFLKVSGLIVLCKVMFFIWLSHSQWSIVAGGSCEKVKSSECYLEVWWMKKKVCILKLFLSYSTVVLYIGINKVWGFLPKNPTYKSTKCLLSDSMAALVRHSQAQECLQINSKPLH